MPVAPSLSSAKTKGGTEDRENTREELPLKAVMATRSAQKTLASLLIAGFLLIASSVWFLRPARLQVPAITKPKALPHRIAAHTGDCPSTSPLVAKQCEWLERPPPTSPLGYDADTAFRRLLKPDEYDQTLEDFVRSSMPESLQSRLLEGIKISPAHDTSIPYTLHQTDLNISFVTGDELTRRMEDLLAGTELLEAYQTMPIGVMISDFYRQMAILLEGGYYADTDAEPLQPLKTWHRLRVGEDSSYRPAFIAAIELNTDKDGKDRGGQDWQDMCFGRPIQLVQWSFAATAMHPISVDILRRFVEVSKAVKVWRAARDRELSFLGKSGSAQRLRERPLWEVLDPPPSHQNCWPPAAQLIIEWLGPIAMTDAVLSYIHRTTGKTWFDVQDALADPYGDSVAFADVLIHPRAAFGAWRGDAIHEQKSLLRHNFHGSWFSQLDAFDSL